MNKPGDEIQFNGKTYTLLEKCLGLWLVVETNNVNAKPRLIEIKK